MSSILIYSGDYKKYDMTSNSWLSVTPSNPTIQDFLNGNTQEEIAQIPESAWKQLSGEVELLCYKYNSTTEETQFNVEIEPSTLRDEFEGKEVSVIAYTDNITQEEAVIEIETEPFDFYHEMGDSFDVLYYTDDESVVGVDLEVTANYTPLDDINEDFDVVTWSSENVENEPLLKFTMSAFPKGQFITHKVDMPFYGSLNQVIVTKLQENDKKDGIIRVLVSLDSGYSFRRFKDGGWIYVDTSNYDNIVQHGNTLSEISAIPQEEWRRIEEENRIEAIRFGFYIEEHIREIDSAKISMIQTNQDDLSETPNINSSSLYILNTKSTIDVQLQRRNLYGSIDDVDKTKVQYRVFLNGDAYYPSDGSFTKLEESPSYFSLNIDHTKIKMNQENYLTVEFQDYWGASDSWSTIFIGTPIGLLFKSPEGDYYANEIGEVLQYLDIGTLVAGQTSVEHEVLLENKIGYKIENVRISTISNQDGVSIEFSKTQSPFEASDSLTFEEQLDEGESIPFYIRLKTERTASPRLGGEFKVRVHADKAIE